MTMLRASTLHLLVVAGLPGVSEPLSAQAQVRVDTAVAVPMRDGVVLRADVWRPAAGDRFPVLVYRTPYGREDAASASGIAGAAVARGYAVVLEDVRGRYGSGGEFEPYGTRGRTATTPSSGPHASRGRMAPSARSGSPTPPRFSGSPPWSGRPRSRPWCPR